MGKSEGMEESCEPLRAEEIQWFRKFRKEAEDFASSGGSMRNYAMFDRACPSLNPLLYLLEVRELKLSRMDLNRAVSSGSMSSVMDKYSMRKAQATSTLAVLPSR